MKQRITLQRRTTTPINSSISLTIFKFFRVIINCASNQDDDKNADSNRRNSKQRSNTFSVRYNHLFLMDGDTSIKLDARYSDTSFDPTRYTYNTMSENNDDELSSFNISDDYEINVSSLLLNVSKYKLTFS